MKFKFLKNSLFWLLKGRNLVVIKREHLESLEREQNLFELIKKIINIELDDRIVYEITKKTLTSSTHSQLLQDVLAVYFNETNPNKYENFFVEFGATDGKTLSNTYLLETIFGWDGILSEPAKSWHKSLISNRKCSIDLRAVWSCTGAELAFQENVIGELSTLSKFANVEISRSQTQRKYIVKTVSLNDLLCLHAAPTKIGFLSIDTEGSEQEIINALDFTRYSFGFITIEHNYSKYREEVFQILSKNGYTRVMQDFSSWDDFYIPSDHPLNAYFFKNL